MKAFVRILIAATLFVSLAISAGVAVYNMQPFVSKWSPPIVNHSIIRWKLFVDRTKRDLGYYPTDPALRAKKNKSATAAR